MHSEVYPDPPHVVAAREAAREVARAEQRASSPVPNATRIHSQGRGLASEKTEKETGEQGSLIHEDGPAGSDREGGRVLERRGAGEAEGEGDGGGESEGEGGWVLEAAMFCGRRQATLSLHAAAVGGRGEALAAWHEFRGDEILRTDYARDLEIVVCVCVCVCVRARAFRGDVILRTDYPRAAEGYSCI